MDLDFHLEGAPNWRAPREESLNVYGVAQPTLPGLKGILSVLGCRPPIAREQPQGKNGISTANVALEARRVSMDDGRRSRQRESSREDIPQGRCVWFCTREEPISEFHDSFRRYLLEPPASVYISGRPFVLRDSSAAKTTMTLSDRAEVLEGIERRLKDDILQESRRYVQLATLPR